LDELTGPGPVYALLILYGLNAVDELDRTAFGILQPEIRDEFGLDLTTSLALIAVVAGALALQVLIAQYSDRHRRVPIASAEPRLGVLPLMTGLVSTVFRRGPGRLGHRKAVVDPTHNSLLADYYPRRTARACTVPPGGQRRRPARPPSSPASWPTGSVGGSVPAVFAVPSIILVVLGLKMRELIRGAGARGDGASAETVNTEESRRRSLRPADLLEDRPPADLVRPALPRRRSSASSPWPRSSTRRSSG
jgi:branched-chain amino acid transport system ATP-binding protein